jgi:hypothetical protein
MALPRQLPAAVRERLCQTPIPARDCCLRAELVGFIQLTPHRPGASCPGVGLPVVTVPDQSAAHRSRRCLTATAWVDR